MSKDQLSAISRCYAASLRRVVRSLLSPITYDYANGVFGYLYKYRNFNIFELDLIRL